MQTAPQPCTGSHSAKYFTGGIADSKGICPECGQRVRIRPANSGGRFTRRGLPVLWNAETVELARLRDVPAVTNDEGAGW